MDTRCASASGTRPASPSCSFTYVKVVSRTCKRIRALTPNYRVVLKDNCGLDERPVAPGNARARHAGGKAAHRPGYLPADAQRAGVRLQSEDQPLAGDGGDRERGPGDPRRPQAAQSRDRVERQPRGALRAQCRPGPEKP